MARLLPRLVAAATTVAAGAALLLAIPAAPTQAAGSGADHTIGSRAVSFEVQNVNSTDVACTGDNAGHTLSGRLVGPADLIAGRNPSITMHVLVHDLGTGGWFWNLRDRPAYDYATQLARRGEVSLVLDRLGYDRSALDDGDATCLGAQASMLHQVVQELYAGQYSYTGTAAQSVLIPPHASRVVLHGHGIGAAVSELEAATYDDVHGLVLMSWSDTGFSPTSLALGQRLNQACLAAGGYTPYADTAADFRSLLFASAPAAVQREAAQRRNAVPCGDATSLAQTVAATAQAAGQVEAPVLVLFGGRDVTQSGTAADQAARFTSSPSVAHRTYADSGSALPLESQAPRVRADVLRWLARHDL